MRRIDVVELHDQPRFPVFLRNLITEALQALWEFGNSYHPILMRLYASLSATSTAVRLKCWTSALVAVVPGCACRGNSGTRIDPPPQT
jgi:hypothetical protein